MARVALSPGPLAQLSKARNPRTEVSQQTSATISTFSVQLKSMTGNVTTVDGVSLDMTVEALKLKYNELTALPVALFGLIAHAKKMPDAATLAEFSVAAGDVIFVMNRTEDAAATWGKEPPPQKKRACSVM